MVTAITSSSQCAAVVLLLIHNGIVIKKFPVRIHIWPANMHVNYFVTELQGIEETTFDDDTITATTTAT